MRIHIYNLSLTQTFDFFFFFFHFQLPLVSSQSSTMSEEFAASMTAVNDKPPEQPKPAAAKPEPLPTLPSQEGSESKKKPAGAVSLFGGIDVLASKQAESSPNEADHDDILFSRESPPPDVKWEEKKEEKSITSAVSLFDEEEEEDESDWNDPIFTPSKPTARNTLKVCLLYTFIADPSHCSVCAQAR